jgi:hypothetical protein
VTGRELAGGHGAWQDVRACRTVWNWIEQRQRKQRKEKESVYA